MKDNKVLYIVIFAVIAVVLLLSGVFFNKNGITAVKLTLDTSYSNIIVCDSSGNAVPNNGELKVGETYVATITPMDGYRLNVAACNSETILNSLNNNKYEFVCVESVKFTARSVINKFTASIKDTNLKVEDSNNNVITKNGQLTIGKTYTITATAIEGYTLSTLTLNNIDILNTLDNNKYQFVCAGDVSIVAKSNINEYAYSIVGNDNTTMTVHRYDLWYENEVSENSSVSVAQANKLYHGVKYVLNFMPNYTTGYTFNNILVNGIDIEVLCSTENSGFNHANVNGYERELQFVFTAIQDIEVVVTEKDLYCAICVNATNTDVSFPFAISSEFAEIGQPLTIQAVPKYGYDFQYLKVNGELKELDSSGYVQIIVPNIGVNIEAYSTAKTVVLTIPSATQTCPNDFYIYDRNENEIVGSWSGSDGYAFNLTFGETYYIYGETYKNLEVKDFVLFDYEKNQSIYVLNNHSFIVSYENLETTFNYTEESYEGMGLLYASVNDDNCILQIKGVNYDQTFFIGYHVIDLAFGTYTITLTPSEGKTISSIKINGETVTNSYVFVYSKESAKNFNLKIEVE